MTVVSSILDFFNIQNITLLIALWGAILSTYKLLSDRNKTKRTLKVEVSYGFMTLENDVGPNTISLTAINTGYRPITLTSVGYLLPDKKTMFIVEPQSNVKFPYTLLEGNQCSVWKIQKKMALELKENGYSGTIKIRGYYRSAIGNLYKSKPIKFDIEKALTYSE